MEPTLITLGPITRIKTKTLSSCTHSRIVDEVRNDEGMKTGELICMECLAKFPDPACPPNRKKA